MSSTKVVVLKGSVFSHARIMEEAPREDCQTAPELYGHEYVWNYSGRFRYCSFCGIPEPEEPTE